MCCHTSTQKLKLSTSKERGKKGEDEEHGSSQDKCGGWGAGEGGMCW